MSSAAPYARSTTWAIRMPSGGRCRLQALMRRAPAEFSRREFLSAAAAGGVGAAMARAQSDVSARPFRADGDASELAALGLGEAADRLRSGKVSPVELTQACLGRIDRLGPRLNAFITVTPESALAEARQAEAEIQRGGYRGALHGIPVALKDLLDTAGVRTTGGSALLKDHVPTQDADA